MSEISIRTLSSWRVVSSRQAQATWERLRTWFDRNLQRAPALMIGLVAVVAIPVLAVLGFVVRRLVAATTSRAVTRRQRDHDVDAGTQAAATPGRDGLTWPVDAWIEIDGRPETRRPVVHDLMRIGRDGDNEIVLGDDSVRRYHAAIRRTEDAEIILVDLGPPHERGLLVNGQTVTETRLRHGDVIAVGAITLRFIARRS